MRISTIQQFNHGVKGITDNYANVTRTQEQVSSGTRILTPADDPVASVRLLQLDQESNKLEQYKANLSAATNSLTQEEASLNSVNNILQRIREIAVSSGNGAMSKEDRQALAAELSEREDELYNVFNSRNARGEYLFGGFQGNAQPFVRNPDGTYTYQGDEGQRSIQIASSKLMAINDSGKNLFVDIDNVNRVATAAASANTGDARISLGVVENKTAYDNTFFPQERVSIVIGADAQSYEIVDANGDPLVPAVTGALTANDKNSYEIRYAGVAVKLDGTLEAGDRFTIERGDVSAEQGKRETRSILESVAFLRQNLESGGDTTEDKLLRRDVIAISLENLDNAMNKVLGVQTTIGARMNVIESTENENAEVSQINQSVQSSLKDLDYAEALSRLSLQTVVLQAAQQSFVKVSGLSLFNLIR